MAEIYVGSAAGYSWYLSCEELAFSQSVANNTSSLTLGLYLRSTTSSTWVAFDSRSAYIGGTSFSIAYRHDGGKHELGRKTFTINHNSDGSASFSTSYGITTSYALNGSGTYSRSIPTIPRASSISSISGNTLGSAVTVNISRASSSFTHEVTYKFGSITRKYTGQGTSCAFTPPVSDATQIPNAASGTATITVQTKSGSTNIGSAVSKSFTLNVPASVVPSFSSLSVARVDNGVPAAWGIYVAGFSKATLTINGATGSQGSTIKGYSISGGGYSSGDRSFTTGVLSAGTQTFIATITDSRGRTATRSVSVSVVAYSNPTLSMTVQRCNSAGTVDGNGTYVRIVPTYSCASVSSKNSIASKRFEVVGTSYNNTSCASGSACVIGSGALSIASSYTIKGTVTDALGRAATLSVTIGTATRIMNVRANGKGLAFGKMAEKDNALESAWAFYAPSATIPTISSTNVNSDYVNNTNSINTKYLNATSSVNTWKLDADCIELSAATPYIDFHYNNSAVDYTTRLVADGASHIRCTNGFIVNDRIYADTGKLGKFLTDGNEWMGIYDAKWDTGKRKAFFGFTGNKWFIIKNEIGDGTNTSGIQLNLGKNAAYLELYYTTSDEFLNYRTNCSSGHWFNGNVSVGALINRSCESAKTNIIPFEKTIGQMHRSARPKGAKEMIRESQIYEYDLIEEQKSLPIENQKARNNKHYGLVVERETPDEVLFYNPESGKAEGVELYAMTSLAWQAIKEIADEMAEKETKMAQEISELKSRITELENLIKQK